MESNRDESKKCINLAEVYLSKGDKERALKFANKAEKLFPSEVSKNLLEKIRTLGGSTQSNGANSPPESNGVRQRRNSAKGQGDGSNGIHREYTKEQVEAVKRIKKCKDYYEILIVSKDAEDSDLRKSYKKLALQLHPDKNHAPGAAEAFKAVGNAYGVLSDSSKRKKYDLYGDEDTSTSRHSHHDYTHGFEAEVTPEDLFNMFFGGGGFVNQTNRQHRRTAQRHTYSTAHSFRRTHTTTEDNAMHLFYQMAPILFLIGLSLLSMLLAGDNPYSFYQSSKYTNRRQTQHLNVEYWVKDDFAQQYYNNGLRRLEKEIESTYLQSLRQECYKERMMKENYKWRARHANDARAYDQAVNMEMKYCSKLESIYG